MVSLNQKTPSSPVSYNATGFYPDKAVMFWKKDGEKLLEGVKQIEMLENQDGTFQMSVDLNVKVDMEDGYECVFQLTGVKEDIVTKLESRSILSNLSGEDLNTSTSGDRTIKSQTTIPPSTTSSTLDVTTESNKATTRPSTTSGTSDVTTESNKATTTPTPGLNKTTDLLEDKVCVGCVVATTLVLTTVIYHHHHRDGQALQRETCSYPSSAVSSVPEVNTADPGSTVQPAASDPGLKMQPTTTEPGLTVQAAATVTTVSEANPQSSSEAASKKFPVPAWQAVRPVLLFPPWFSGCPWISTPLLWT
ncbi:mucin-2-like [Nerophis ophidion]|uniref:mucin-2-like n=1 Tax=Nerophis ophidion TaxID=159077 RepID=UPI002ADF90B7|nr:mucin-2-like [Nerophis ophidion]